ncbi:MAG: MFS transporter [Emergencia sp.]|nr:MFS transporter [Emergencia sp.]
MRQTNRFRLFYGFGYGAMGVVNPLIGQYMGSIGFSGTQIGTVTSLATAIAVFAATFWGDRYANSRDGRKVIALICILAGMMSLVNSIAGVFILFLFSYGIQYFFQGPVMGMSDALVLESEQENFSSIRLCGAVGYAAAVFIGGKIGGVLGLKTIFYMNAVCFSLAALTVLTVKASAVEKSGHGKRKPSERVRYSALLSEKRALQLIVCGIFVMGSNVANNTYFGFLFTEGGGTVSGVGTAFLLMVGSEAPFMALAPKLCRRFSREKTIFFAMVLSAVRFGLYALGPSDTFLLATFFLQGMVNGILLTEYVKYLSEAVDVRLIALAVAAFYAVSSNGGTILCSFLGGVAMDLFGATGVYALFSGMNAVGAALYMAFGLHRKTEKVMKE